MHFVKKLPYSRFKKRSAKVGDYRYGSSREGGIAVDLESRQDAGEIRSWRKQPVVELRVNGIKICEYRLDFEVEHNDGTTELIEVKKGLFGSTWQFKWRLLEAIYSKEHPEVKLTLIK